MTGWCHVGDTRYRYCCRDGTRGGETLIAFQMLLHHVQQLPRTPPAPDVYAALRRATAASPKQPYVDCTRRLGMKTDTYSPATFSKFTHCGPVGRWIIRQPSAFISFYCAVFGLR